MVPKGWDVQTINDIALVSSGGTPSRTKAEYWGGEIPWATTAEIQYDTILDTSEKITPSGLENSSAKLFPSGTILMAMYGQGKTRGKVAKLGIESTTNQACAAIQLKKYYLVDFYFQFLQSQYENIRKLSNSGSQENLNAALVKSIRVPVPPFLEQKKIAKILSIWDQTISTTEKLLANSQLQKKVLMQQLLKGGRRLPEFQHSKWQKVSLSELVEINYGKSPAAILCEDGRYPVIGTGGINGSTNTAMFAGPSVVIGRKGTIDRPHFIDGPFWSIDTTFYCVPKSGCSIKWFYYLSRSLPWKLYNEGSGVPSLSRDTIGSIRVLAPSRKEQEKIAQILTVCEKHIENLEIYLRLLKDEKKSLMQQLLTGKRRVKLDIMEEN